MRPTNQIFPVVLAVPAHLLNGSFVDNSATGRHQRSYANCHDHFRDESSLDTPLSRLLLELSRSSVHNQVWSFDLDCDSLHGPILLALQET